MPPDARRAWSRDHPWAKAYDLITGNEVVGGVLWRVGMGSDLGLMHRTAGRALERLAPGAAVLDIPCGGGVVLRDVPRGLVLRYVAADISPAMLARTQAEADRRQVSIETSGQDVGALTFDDGSFDLALAYTSLHCFPEPEAAVHELARVLRPGGRLVGSTMLRSDWRSAAAWIGGSTMGVLGPGCTADELAAWMTAAGMVDIELQRSGGITHFDAVRAS